MKRRFLCAAAAACVLLSACGQSSAVPESTVQETKGTAAEAEAAESNTQAAAETGTAADASESTVAEATATQAAAVQDTEETAAAAETAAVSAKEETAGPDDASAYVSDIDNANIDAAIYLDYSAGIEAGVYKWILSEDGDYYTLAAVDENGEPVTAEEAKINVGANNEESIDNGSGGAPEGMPGSQNGGDKKGQGQGKGQGGFGGDMPGGHGGPGGMGGFGGFGSQGTVYQGVYMNANVTNLSNQTMLVYVPAAYMTTDEAGNVTGIDHDAAVGNYTADTAPVIYLNECGGWKSSSPRSADTAYLEQGMIYVTAGARSRDAMDESGTLHTGKAPTQIADLKSGIIELRANSDVIPGDKDRIVSIGTSGGGQMSSILGASGNMPEYYEYLYEAGALGVTKNEDGSYASIFPDNVYGAQLYCPIADFENADLAYAWWWVDLADDGGTYGGSMTEFERRLQELEAEAFVEYLNGLGLKDEEGNELTLTGLRSGSYYDKVLQNISDALNAYAEAGEIDPAAEYPDSGDWLVQNEDGSWSVTDMRGFMIGTGLVNNRNKAIPGFDTFAKTSENDAFGRPETEAVHFAAGVAQILKDNYEELSGLEGFDAAAVDTFIEEALTGEDAAFIENQTDLLNATEIMLRAAGALTGENADTKGPAAVDPALYWRDRSGTADQHTSFSVGYNILLAAQMMGRNIDYHLVWNMGHGSNEGSSTGTFIDWVNDIME